MPGAAPGVEYWSLTFPARDREGDFCASVLVEVGCDDVGSILTLNGVVDGLVAGVGGMLTCSLVLTGVRGLLSCHVRCRVLASGVVLTLVRCSMCLSPRLGRRLGLSATLYLTVDGAELVLHRLRHGRLLGRVAGRRPASLLVGLVLDHVDGVLGLDPAACWQSLAMRRLVRGVGGLDLFGDHIVLAVFGRAQGVGCGRGGLGGIVVGGL